MVQTAATKYVEMNGKWQSIALSGDDRVEALAKRLKTAKMT